MSVPIHNDDDRGATPTEGVDSLEARGSNGPISQATPADSAPEKRERRDRRQNVVDNRPLHTGLERRRGPGRRRSDFIKSAEEGQMSQEQFLFVMAIDAYKRVNQKPFPTWTEVLEVIRKLGYRKTCASVLQMAAAEDWTEPSNALPFPPKVEAEPLERAEALRGETDEND
jgi:hypothetical protein